MVDELAPRQQGQGTGLGWNLGPDAAVFRDTKGTLTTADDTFRLTFEGVGYDLVLIDSSQNIYHTKDEAFFKVQYTASGDYWTVTTKDGTRHRLGFNTESKAIKLGPDGLTPVTYRYQVDEITSTSGVSVRYAWVKQTAVLQSTGQTYDRAMYPDTITWSYFNGSPVSPLRQIRFLRAPRLDWTDTSTPTAMAFFETDRVDTIEVWVGSSLVRKYVFGFDYSIDRDPTYTWGGGAAGDLTLRTLTMYGSDGTSSLPTLSFGYTGARLMTVSNGLGGTATYTYEHVTTAPLSTACQRTSGGNCVDWNVSTSEGLPILGHLVTSGSTTDSVPLYATCQRQDGSGNCLDWGLSTSSGTLLGRLMTTAGLPGTVPLYSACLVPDGSGGCLDWGASTTTGTLLGYLYVAPVDRYRVAARTVTDGRGNTWTTNLIYRDLALSADGAEFRGHRLVRSLDPLGHYTDIWFRQDDALKGRPFQIEARSNTDALYTQTLNTHSSSNPYPGVTFVSLTRADKVICDGGQSCRQTVQTFEYDNHGNQTWTHDWGDATINGDERHLNTTWVVDTNNWIHRRSATALYNDVWAGLRVTWLFYDGLAHGSVGSRGLLTKEESKLNGYIGTAGNPVKTREYDGYGNLIAQTDARGCRTTTTYDTAQTYPAVVTNCLGHVTALQYDARWGAKASETDPNNQTTTYAYDALGRLTRVTGPLDTTSQYGSVSYAYLDVGNPSLQRILTSRTERHGFADVLWTDEYFDGLGRVYLSRSKSIGSDVTHVDTTLDSRGLVAAKSAPHFPSETAVWTQYTYDAIGRRTHVLNADGTTINTAYSPGVTTTTDERGKVKRHLYDAYDQLIRVDEVTAAGTYVTTHTYDAAGSRLRTTNHAGHVTTATYDLLGRRIAMADPNMGSWTYSYDAAGSSLTQTDAKNRTITFAYDALGRTLTKTYPG
ncbi:MAG TPA: hypothetical protein VGT02_07470, partial [Methylomirabilota bacterium]|nr:hypothetical protein [Methylomirabilota bacterium]